MSGYKIWCLGVIVLIFEVKGLSGSIEKIVVLDIVFLQSYYLFRSVNGISKFLGKYNGLLWDNL